MVFAEYRTNVLDTELASSRYMPPRSMMPLTLVYSHDLFSFFFKVILTDWTLLNSDLTRTEIIG
jgi:hypothetical protein